MSLMDYKESEKLANNDYGFYALIMAAMMRADSFNANTLKKSFPDVWKELEARYNSGGGILPDD